MNSSLAERDAFVCAKVPGAFNLDATRLHQGAKLFRKTLVSWSIHIVG